MRKIIGKIKCRLGIHDYVVFFSYADWGVRCLRCGRTLGRFGLDDRLDLLRMYGGGWYSAPVKPRKMSAKGTALGKDCEYYHLPEDFYQPKTADFKRSIGYYLVVPLKRKEQQKKERKAGRMRGYDNTLQKGP